MTDFYTLLTLLALSITLIVVLTTRFSVHPFFSLVLSALLMGLFSGLPFLLVLDAMKDGFGHLMKSLAFLIVMGTTLGILLEKSGSTAVLASFITRSLGQKRAPLSMSVAGFITGLPIFCDSGFIVLSGLNKALAARATCSLTVLSVCLATGLYSVHCLIPPHPGASAAATTLNVDFGKMMLFGIIAAIPASIVGYWWASRFHKLNDVPQPVAEPQSRLQAGPSVVMSLIPIVLPIFLIALKSFSNTFFQTGSFASGVAQILGDPVIALALSVGFCLLFFRRQLPDAKHALGQSIEKSGSILIIIGAGAAFGAVLTATGIGQLFGRELPLDRMGIFFPFLLTALLKTAQGSSTVAIITAASIVSPLLPALGLDTESGRLFTVLAMGAGSMMLSHANDAYFWVISTFENIPVKTMIRVYSIATVLMALTAFAATYAMSSFF